HAMRVTDRTRKRDEAAVAITRADECGRVGDRSADNIAWDALEPIDTIEKARRLVDRFAFEMAHERDVWRRRCEKRWWREIGAARLDRRDRACVARRAAAPESFEHSHAILRCAVLT